MMQPSSSRLVILTTWLGLSALGMAQTVSPVQSAARPYNLSIAAPVQVAGSDAASKAFQTDVLPGMMQLVNQRLGERLPQNLSGFASISLDPSKLKLATDSTARVYFLGEGAAYKNTLGFSTTGNGPLSRDAELIFPDASSAAGYGGSGSLLRSSGEPLMAGDFVDLGKFQANTALEFFLVVNGASGGKEFFSTNSSINKDGIVHAVTLAGSDSAYLVIGFEDLYGGGDKDYNDLVFAVEIDKTSMQAITGGMGAPEPSLAMGSLVSVVALMGLSRRRPARAWTQRDGHRAC